MGKLFLMILNIMRSGSETMPVPMKDLGAMIGPATLTGQGTLRGEGRTCRTSRTEMHLLGSRVSTALLLARTRAACLHRRHHLVRTVATIRHHILKVPPQITNPKCRTHRQGIHREVHPRCRTHRQGTHPAVHPKCRTHRQDTHQPVHPKCRTSRQGTQAAHPICQTSSPAMCPAVLLTISKVVQLATKVDLLVIRVVTKVTKEATCLAALDQHIQAAILDTNLNPLAKFTAILAATMAMHQVAIISSKVKEEAQTTNEVAPSPQMNLFSWEALPV